MMIGILERLMAVVPSHRTQPNFDRRRLSKKSATSPNDGRRGLDTQTESFREEARRQSRVAAKAASEADDQAFVDSISEWPDG